MSRQFNNPRGFKGRSGTGTTPPGHSSSRNGRPNQGNDYHGGGALGWNTRGATTNNNGNQDRQQQHGGGESSRNMMMTQQTPGPSGSQYQGIKNNSGGGRNGNTSQSGGGGGDEDKWVYSPTSGPPSHTQLQKMIVSFEESKERCLNNQLFFENRLKQIQLSDPFRGIIPPEHWAKPGAPPP